MELSFGVECMTCLFAIEPPDLVDTEADWEVESAQCYYFATLPKLAPELIEVFVALERAESFAVGNEGLAYQDKVAGESAGRLHRAPVEVALHKDSLA